MYSCTYVHACVHRSGSRGDRSIRLVRSNQVTRFISVHSGSIGVARAREAIPHLRNDAHALATHVLQSNALDVYTVNEDFPGL